MPDGRRPQAVPVPPRADVQRQPDLQGLARHAPAGRADADRRAARSARCLRRAGSGPVAPQRSAATPSARDGAIVKSLRNPAIEKSSSALALSPNSASRPSLSRACFEARKSTRKPALLMYSSRLKSTSTRRGGVERSDVSFVPRSAEVTLSTRPTTSSTVTSLSLRSLSSMDSFPCCGIQQHLHDQAIPVGNPRVPHLGHQVAHDMNAEAAYPALF